MPEIILKNLTKRFGKSVAVENLNLTIGDREFVTLLGPSGCGKTTTLRMIAGLETPTEGEILIDGKLVFSAEKGIDISPDKRDVGFLFQNYALWPHMTVYNNIAFGLQNLKWAKDKIAERVNELCGTLKIEDLVGRYPAELSGGQQQRVAIARTLATGPKVLFMDEPLSNLDAKLRMEMRTELKRLHMETDSTFVYVTHDQLEAMTLSTRICLLKEGDLQQYEPPLDIYHNPVNLFVADFVGSPNMNTMEGRGSSNNPSEITLQCGGLNLLFTPRSSPITLEKEQPVAIGIRPEYIRICGEGESGKAKGTIYSTLPSGMETIVRIEIGGQHLTCVVFGGVDFKVNEVVDVDFDSDVNILFDSQTGKNLAQGRLDVIP